MARKPVLIGSHELMDSGSVLAGNDDLIQFFPFDEGETGFDIYFRLKTYDDQTNSTETVENEDGSLTIEVHYNYTHRPFTANVKSVVIGSDDDFDIYFSYEIRSIRLADNPSYLLTYNFTRAPR